MSDYKARNRRHKRARDKMLRRVRRHLRKTEKQAGKRGSFWETCVCASCREIIQERPAVKEPAPLITDQERNLLSSINDMQREMGKLTQTINERRRMLVASGVCTHSQTTTYEWEHDNGYGDQNKVIGLRCIACLLVRRWKSSQLWTPE